MAHGCSLAKIQVTLVVVAVVVVEEVGVSFSETHFSHIYSGGIYRRAWSIPHGSFFPHVLTLTLPAHRGPTAALS